MCSFLDFFLSLVFTICDHTKIHGVMNMKNDIIAHVHHTFLYDAIIIDFKKKNPRLTDVEFDTVIIQIWCHLYGFEYKFGFDNMKDSVADFVHKNKSFLLNDKNEYTGTVLIPQCGYFHIPCKFDMEFLACWCTTLDSFSQNAIPTRELISPLDESSRKSMIPLTDWFPKEISDYLMKYGNLSDFSANDIPPVDIQYKYYRDFVILNIDHMNN